LFGVFEDPADGGQGERGVLMCYPHGSDYDTAFRSFRILATRLARAGVHVLRFDYSGTGDSSRDIDEVSISTWLDDIAIAVDELEQSRQVRAIAVLGLRLGATLAALASTGCPIVDRLVLWEPVIDGRDYVARQRALHRAWIDEEVRNGREARVADDDLLGYRLTEALRTELERVNLWSLSKAPTRDIHLVSQAASSEQDRVAEHLRATGARVHTHSAAGPEIWSKTPSMDRAVVPHSVLPTIIECLTAESR
jgi:pimeloyl-ACP methyl ester carboxylesterase